MRSFFDLIPFALANGFNTYSMTATRMPVKTTNHVNAKLKSSYPCVYRPSFSS